MAKIHLKKNNAHKYISTNVYNGEVHSVNEFIQILNSFKPKNIKQRDNYNQLVPSRIFYRGESKLYGNTSNVAGVYRGNYQESALYHAYMRRFYKKFRNMNNFSKLTYMQHFGLPTCLLDVTSNPLVALYFSCGKTYHYNDRDEEGTSRIRTDDNASGVVQLILPRDRSYKIYNSYSDTIEILSTLALLKTRVQYKIFNDIERFNKDISYNDVDYSSFYHKLINRNEHYYDVNYISNMYHNLYHTYEFQNFIHKIRQDVGDFTPTINFKGLFLPKIVQPALNNRRVEAQQGYFIFQSYPSNHIKGDLLNKEKKISHDINKNFIVKSIKISNTCKHRILNDLDTNYGINRSKLFPDYENIAKYTKYAFDTL